MTLDECLHQIEEKTTGPYNFSLSVYKNKNKSIKIRIRIRESEKGYSLDYVERILDFFNIIPITPTEWELTDDLSLRAPIASDYKYTFSYSLHAVNI